MPAYDKVKAARAKGRATAIDYINNIFTHFLEMHGDRRFGDDKSIITGIGFLDDMAVTVIGIEKGRNISERRTRNSGSAHPEGYRKALRQMKLAEKFGRPVICLVDTSGAYCGIGPEERGQGQAIAENLMEMMTLKVPIISVIIGEGGSGGALALGVANQVFMLENAVYSVITPESCASIIYRDSSKAEQAAAALKLSAPDMLELSLIDGIIPEPQGGAHENHDEAARLIKGQLCRSLQELSGLTPDDSVERRYARFRKMGNFFTGA